MKPRGVSRLIDDKEKISNLKGCLLPKPKSPTPRRKDLLSETKSICQHKNYIGENIRCVQNTKHNGKSDISQDSCTGHCQNLEQAGLQLKYVFKKGYGKTPNYIRRHRKHLEHAKQTPEEQESSKMRYIDEQEKGAVLNGLRNNLREVEKQLLSLPVITDTFSKQKRKLNLENRLAELEKDIAILENNDIIVIRD